MTRKNADLQNLQLDVFGREEPSVALAPPHKMHLAALLEGLLSKLEWHSLSDQFPFCVLFPQDRAPLPI